MEKDNKGKEKPKQKASGTYFGRPLSEYWPLAVIAVLFGGAMGYSVIARHFLQGKAKKALGPAYDEKLALPFDEALVILQTELNDQISDLKKIRDEAKDNFESYLVDGTNGDRESVTVKVNTGFLCLRSERTMTTKKTFTVTGEKTFEEAVSATISRMVDRYRALVFAPIGIVVWKGSGVISSGTLFNSLTK